MIPQASAPFARRAIVLFDALREAAHIIEEGELGFALCLPLGRACNVYLRVGVHWICSCWHATAPTVNLSQVFQTHLQLN